MKRPFFAAFMALSICFFSQVDDSNHAQAVARSSPAATQRSGHHQLGSKIAKSATAIASDMNSKGYCYRGVKRALKTVGVKLTGGSAYMAKAQLLKDKRFQVISKAPKLKKQDLNSLRKGDILVHGKSKRHPNGHIAVYLGNNKEASDHIQKLVTGASYSSTTVFRATGKQSPSTMLLARKLEQETSTKKSSGKNMLASRKRKPTLQIAAKRQKPANLIAAKKQKPSMLLASKKQRPTTIVARKAPPKANRVMVAHSEALQHAIRVAKPSKPPTHQLAKSAPKHHVQPKLALGNRQLNIPLPPKPRATGITLSALPGVGDILSN